MSRKRPLVDPELRRLLALLEEQRRQLHAAQDEAAAARGAHSPEADALEALAREAKAAFDATDAELVRRLGF